MDTLVYLWPAIVIGLSTLGLVYRGDLDLSAGLIAGGLLGASAVFAWEDERVLAIFLVAGWSALCLAMLFKDRWDRSRLRGRLRNRADVQRARHLRDELDNAIRHDWIALYATGEEDEHMEGGSHLDVLGAHTRMLEVRDADGDALVLALILRIRGWTPPERAQPSV